MSNRPTRREGTGLPAAGSPAPQVRPGRDRRELDDSWRSRWPALAVTAGAGAALVLSLWLLLWTLLPAALGWQVTVVMSGSMSPQLQVGDVAVARPVDPDELRPGMVLLVDDPDHPGRLRIHRLVGLEDGGLRLKGDANPQADSTLVDPTHVHGTGALRIPLVGMPLVWWADGDLLPLLGVAGGVLLTAAATTVYRRPGTSGPAVLSLRSRRVRSRGAHRAAPRATHRAAESARPVRHRHRPAGRARLGIAAIGSAVVALALVTTGTADARYSTTTAQGPESWTANAYYTCAQAATATATPAQLYYPLQETTGTVADNAGSAGTSGDGTYTGGIVLNQAGPNCRGAGRAVVLDGIDDYITSPLSVTNPTSYSLEAWIRTPTAGGLVVGFRRDGGTGNDNDRMIYMSDDGRLNFGVEPTDGVYRTLSSAAGYANNAWHHVVATQGAGGMALYVDGTRVANNAAYTTAYNATGTWRIGRGQTAGWPAEPTNRYYDGSIAHVAVYQLALSATQVTAHYNAGR